MRQIVARLRSQVLVQSLAAAFVMQAAALKLRRFDPLPQCHVRLAQLPKHLDQFYRFPLVVSLSGYP